jgi:hypothetical protein
VLRLKACATMPSSLPSFQDSRIFL